jgi:FixJ family two-component response regulator
MDPHSVAEPPLPASLSVLVIDDRKDVATTIAGLCRAAGFAAEIGEGGTGIRAQLDRHRPTCLILDIMMPDEDGYEALREIARFDRTLPVLLVTGYGDTWLRMGVTLGRAQGLELVQASPKPLRTEALRAFLQAATVQRSGV